MQVIRFGIIGCGLMGREFASAAARWCHLTDIAARPEIVAVCNRTAAKMDWFTAHFPTIRQATTDYRELLANDEVDAVYCAVPHNLHEETYCAVIESGKHLFGEKPFGIDRAAYDAIAACLRRHPRVFTRCCSQFPFFPGVQRIGSMIEQGTFGRIIEVEAGFLHSSDLNPAKPINWKRQIKTNGEYGVMGDLGMHICHVPLRAGWRPRNVRAILSNIVPERPDGKGGMAPCETWDNATLLCEAEDAAGERFPLTLKTQRIAPGETNTWFLRILGTQAAAEFTTRRPTLLRLLEYQNGRQDWRELDLGYETAFPTITGGIFEFGFGDAILQMWASYVDELHRGAPRGRFSGTATVEEVGLSHQLFTAALRSQREQATVPVV